jgi:hypothetical protein
MLEGGYSGLELKMGCCTSPLVGEVTMEQSEPKVSEAKWWVRGCIATDRLSLIEWR